VASKWNSAPSSGISESLHFVHIVRNCFFVSTSTPKSALYFIDQATSSSRGIRSVQENRADFASPFVSTDVLNAYIQVWQWSRERIGYAHSFDVAQGRWTRDVIVSDGKKNGQNSQAKQNKPVCFHLVKTTRVNESAWGMPKIPKGVTFLLQPFA